MNKSPTNLFKNIFSIGALQVLGYIVPLAVIPYLTKVLSIDSFSAYSLSLSIVVLSQFFLDYGFSSSSVYIISERKGDIKYISQYLSSIYIIKALFFIAFSIFLIAIKILLNWSIDWILLILTLFIIFCHTYQPFWFYQSIEINYKIIPFILVAKTIFLILIFLLVKEEDDVVITIFCFSISSFIIFCIMNIGIYRCGYSLSRTQLKDVLKILKEGFSFFLSRLAVMSYTACNILILNFLSSIEDVALYALSEKLYQAGQRLMSPISQVFYPHISRTKDISIFLKYVSSVVITYLFVFLLIGPYLKDIIGYIFGENYESAVDVIYILLFCLVINFVGVNFGYPLFASIKRPELTNLTTYFGSIVFISSLFYVGLFSQINSHSIALSLLIAELCVLLSRCGLYIRFKFYYG